MYILMRIWSGTKDSVDWALRQTLEQCHDCAYAGYLFDCKHPSATGTTISTTNHGILIIVSDATMSKTEYRFHQPTSKIK